MIEEVAGGIYAVEHSAAEGKNVIVFGESVAVAIDVGTYPEEGQQMADFIRGKGYAAKRVIITHGHRDHILGGEAFQGADVFAPRETVAEIQRQIPTLCAQMALDEAAISARILHPTITFHDQLWMNVDDKALHLFPTPGHSRDIVSIYLEKQRLLIASDTVVTGIVPAIFYSSRRLEESISRLRLLEIDTLIAGHGPVLFGSEAIQDWLNWLITYISGVRRAIRTLLNAGERDSETIIASVDYDAYIGDRLPKDMHGMPKRHRDTVRQIMEEELAAL